jgi:Gas vesicle synthesis protein GvpL/GvpF
MDPLLRVPKTLRYVYAVADAVPRRWRPPTEGVDGACVLAIRVDTLTLVASPIVSPPPVTPRVVARHQEVVASLIEARAVLPFPPGTTVAEADVGVWLQSRLRRVREALDDVAGCVEMTVRMLRLDAIPGGRDGGASGERLRAVADRLVERAGLPRWRYRPSARDGWGASLAFLVPRGDVPAFLAHIAPVATRAEGLAVVPTGPSAPWSFAPLLDEAPVAARAG